MVSTLLVAFGGALGAVARFKLSEYVFLSYPDTRFPLGTFLVNVIGCLLIGALAGLSERSDLMSTDLKFFLMTGVLGGFTTYSAFGLETFSLVRRSEFLVAGSYVGLSVVVGLLAVWLGFILTGPAR